MVCVSNFRIKKALEKLYCCLVLQCPHHFGDRMLRWYRQTYVEMILPNMSLNYLNPHPQIELLHLVPDRLSYIFAEYLVAMHQNDMVFTLPYHV